MRVKISKNSIEAQPCTSYLSRAIGLMFTPKPKPLLFIFKKEAIYPLHMWFVFFPIDVVFMDKAKRVVELKEDFRSFTLYSPKHKAQYILELPRGSIKRFRIKKGAKLYIK
ncbi:DUF192 domain-containing protein [Candidatus Woesearchaeota archaeon]|nr:DUF192 domain-containing protein [Candidatus Woesearchaeota archaeon]